MRASPLHQLVCAQQRQQARRLAIATLAAVAASVSATLLLGLSGWFLSAAAVAGAAGPAAVLAFNYLLPSAGIRFLAIVRTAARYIERVAGHEAALKALAEIRPAVFAGLAAGPPERSLQVSRGEASARLVQDVDAIETLFVRLAAPWAGGGAVLVGAVLIAMASLWAAAAFLALFVMQVGLGMRLGTHPLNRPEEDVLAANGRLKDAFLAVAAAAPELRCNGLTPRVIETLMAQAEVLGEARVRVWSAEGLAGLAPALLTGLAVAVVLGLSAAAPSPLVALAALAAATGMEGGAGLARMFDHDGAARAAAKRLDELLAADGAGPASSPSDLASSLSLPKGAATIVLGPGERLAIVGRSGSGKTRLLETLIGLRAPRAGGLMVAGRPLETLAVGDLRSLFALAPQDAGMISGTVRDNLVLGDPAASDEALWSALADAALDAKVRAMPQGLDTWIGEGGAHLSGGERRRLSLARALLRPAPWLLLDEPTEGLDAETEQAVVRALHARLARTGQGAIIASHRPAPLTLCDQRLSVGD